jgi:hypothetical protein
MDQGTSGATSETPMPRYTFLLPALGLIGLLSACQLGGGQTALPDDVTPNAVAGDAIEVTALDAPPATDAAPEADAAPAEAEATAPAQADPATPDVASDPEPEPVAEPAPQPDLSDPVPETAKSDQQRACEKKGGKWAKTGKGNFRICVYETKDANKQCTRESDCDGVCLARSGTCSPFKPLIGCNEILQDNGARVTLCIE